MTSPPTAGPYSTPRGSHVPPHGIPCGSGEPSVSVDLAIDRITSLAEIVLNADAGRGKKDGAPSRIGSPDVGRTGAIGTVAFAWLHTMAGRR
jgi:hypothetical protein